MQMLTSRFSVTSLRLLDPEMLTKAIRGADLEAFQLSGHPVPSELTRIRCPRICLDLASVGPAMLYTGAMPRDCYTLSFVIACPGGGRSFNFATDFTDGYMGFFPPGATLDASSPAGSADAILTVPEAVFHAALTTYYPEIPDRVLARGAGMRVGPGEQVYLRSLLAGIHNAVWNHGEQASSDLSCCKLERTLLPAFLAALRSGCSAITPPPNERVARRYRRLRQARDYLAAHQHEPIHVDDLCSDLDLSERGVENLFRDFTGLGPAAFLRRQRLHYAHRALQRAARSTGKVKEIALGSGFWHLGHFSQNYCRLFGESPSETLALDQRE